MDDRTRADDAGSAAGVARGEAADHAAGLAADLATKSILAAVQELGRAQAVAARLVDAAECRLRAVVGEHTAGGAITAAQAEALMVGGVPAARSAPDMASGPDVTSGIGTASAPASQRMAMAGAWDHGQAGRDHRHHRDHGDDIDHRDHRDHHDPGSDPLDLQPVDRLLSLFAARLPSRDEIRRGKTTGPPAWGGEASGRS